MNDNNNIFHPADDHDFAGISIDEQQTNADVSADSSLSSRAADDHENAEGAAGDNRDNAPAEQPASSAHTYDTYTAYKNNGEDENEEFKNEYSSSSSSPYHTYYEAPPSSGGGHNRSPKRNDKAYVVLAGILTTLCLSVVGAGAYGVKKYLSDGATVTAASVETIDGNEKTEEKAAADEKKKTALTEETEADTDQETAETTVSDDVANSSGLVLSDAEAPTTEISTTVEKVMPSVVSVYNSYTQTTEYFGQTYTSEEESTGSGIIVGKTEKELLIVSNNHVVDGADSLKVQFIDGTNASAAIKGTDSSADLAVIAVQLSDIESDTLNQISVATLNASGNTKVGENVIAIGNALGYGQSVTTGIVSAVDREISQEDGITGTFIQTDAAINPGNSGGALLNANGEVIGINSSKIGGSTIEGMGFAIPISKALPIIEDLMSQDTKVKVDEDSQGTLGITGVTVTSEVASAYGMPQGVYVAYVLEGGGAADSNLQKGDIITSIGGVSIISMETLQKQLQYYEAGKTVTLTVQRQDGSGAYAETKVEVTLGDKASLEKAETAQNNNNGPGNVTQQGGAGQPGEEQYNNQQNSYYGNSFGSMFPFGF